MHTNKLNEMKCSCLKSASNEKECFESEEDFEIPHKNAFAYLGNRKETGGSVFKITCSFNSLKQIDVKVLNILKDFSTPGT